MDARPNALTHRSWIGRALLFTTLALPLAACGDDPDIPDCETDQDSETCQVFKIVNIERASADLPSYAWNQELALAAQLHAEDMVDNDYFDHTSLDGRSFSERAQDADYAGFPRGENIAFGQATPEQVMDDWMNSSGHRSNILSDADEIGVGFASNHWVQVFGQGQ